MHSLVYIFGALGMGAIVSIYMPMISETSKIMGSPLAGNIPFFAIAFITSVALFFVVGDMNSISNVKSIPPTYLLAGVLSALMILGMSFLIPILGIRRFLILIIAGQLIMSVIAGHFGLLGVPQDYISVKKVIGVIFMLVGVSFTVSE